MDEQENVCVWVVTLWGKDEPIVTVFNDVDPAQKYYNFMVEHSGDKMVCMDCVPIYSNFIVRPS